MMVIISNLIILITTLEQHHNPISKVNADWLSIFVSAHVKRDQTGMEICLKTTFWCNQNFFECSLLKKYFFMTKPN